MRLTASGYTTPERQAAANAANEKTQRNNELLAVIAQSFLGHGYYLHPYRKKDAASVRSSRPVWQKGLAHRVGNDMTASLVTDTIRDALQKEKVTKTKGLNNTHTSIL